MKPKFVLDPQRVRQLSAYPGLPMVFASASDKEIFMERRWSEVLRLKELLTAQGFVSNLDRPIDAQIDFFIVNDVGVSRGFLFSIINRNMVSKRLIESIFGLLDNFKEITTVVITNEFTDSDELFFLVVTSDVVLGEFETVTTAERFGFDPNSGPIGAINE